jgi:hypothetical protein
MRHPTTTSSGADRSRASPAPTTPPCTFSTPPTGGFDLIEGALSSEGRGYAVLMPDPRLPDYTHLVPTTAPPDREVDLTHVAHVEGPGPESVLHLGKGPAETACGEARGHLEVTDHREVFEQARAGRLAAYPCVCDACHAHVGGTSGGAYRSRG